MPLDLTHVADAPDITDSEIICALATLMVAMRKRGIVRTKNIVGDLGETYALRAYGSHDSKKPINLARTNTADIDASDVDGTTFAIKSVSPTSDRTSAFHFEIDRNVEEKAFDYLIVVRVSDLLQPTQVYEYTWEQFWRVKTWSKTQKAWYLPLNRKVIQMALVVFPTSGQKC